MEVTDNLLQQFLFNLLCKRKRRRNLMLRFHTRMPFKGATLDQVFQKFIQCILHHPIRLQIGNSYLSCFGGELRIHFTWLTLEERNTVHMIVSNKEKLFRKITVLESNEVIMSQCIFDKQLTSSYAIENRRELVRDFVYYLLHVQKDVSKEIYKYYLKKTCLKIITVSREVDRFVFELHNGLARNSVQNLLTYY